MYGTPAPSSECQHPEAWPASTYGLLREVLDSGALNNHWALGRLGNWVHVVTGDNDCATQSEKDEVANEQLENAAIDATGIENVTNNESSEEASESVIASSHFNVVSDEFSSDRTFHTAVNDDEEKAEEKGATFGDLMKSLQSFDKTGQVDVPESRDNVNDTFA